MLQPIISFRNNQSPYNALSTLAYIQSAPSGAVLPVLAGEESNYLQFRVYNNYTLTVGIASALNCKLTTYDGSSASSHTAAKSVISQKWIKLQQMGFGESSGAPAPYTYWKSDELPVGGFYDTFVQDKGSDGSVSPIIRAGTYYNGCGFLEVRSTAELPDNAAMTQSSFVITLLYEWVS